MHVTPATETLPATSPATEPSARTIRLAATALVTASLLTLAAVASPKAGTFVVGSLLLFMAPGVLLVRRTLDEHTPGSFLTALAFGSIAGFGTSSLALLALWAAGGRGAWLLAAAPVIAAALAVPAARWRGRIAYSPLGRRDVVALLLLLMIVPLIVGRPFARVGEEQPDGKAYRAYFTADYVWRMAVVAELAKGDMPPQNVFYRGDSLRYYWLPHLPSAVQYRAAGGWASLDEVLLVGTIVIDFAFVAFLYVFVRQFVSKPGAAALACTGPFLFFSFEGLHQLVALYRLDQPFAAVKYLNIDAVTRWIFRGMPIDGLQRLLWYQPHHAVGYALGFLALAIVALRKRTMDPGVMALAGCLLGTSLLISSFAALMLAAAVGVYEAASALAVRQFRRLAVHGMAALTPFVVAVVLARLLQYVDEAENVAVLGVNPVALVSPVWNSFLSFGPMLLLGIIGALLASWRRLPRVSAIGALAFVCLFFYFFVDVKDHQHVYVGWRVGHFLFIGFAALAGLALQELWRHGPLVRRTGAVVVAVLALAALPTTVIDIYNTQDVTNRAQAPGFRWTLILTPDEQNALRWIRENTEPDALVQVEPFSRNSETWAYIPAFAERRMSAGYPISMVPLEKYRAASERMRRIYTTEDPVEAFEIAMVAGVNYLLVGPAEHAAYPDCDDRFASVPTLFRPVFESGTVTVYEVVTQLGGRMMRRAR
jgi:hypothetical protein